MINNPNLIEEIKEQLKNTTRKKLDEAMKLTDEEEKKKMLKIKDNVDLKELEKFGFKDDDYKGKYYYRTKLDQPLIIYINKWNRIIYLFSNTNSLETVDIITVLYDLIQAGLVEKE